MTFVSEAHICAILLRGQQISWLAARSITYKFIRLFDPSIPEKPTDYDSHGYVSFAFYDVLFIMRLLLTVPSRSSLRPSKWPLWTYPLCVLQVSASGRRNMVIFPSLLQLYQADSVL